MQSTWPEIILEETRILLGTSLGATTASTISLPEEAQEVQED